MKMETKYILLQMFIYISRLYRPSPGLCRDLILGEKFAWSCINMCIYINVSIMSPNGYGDINGDAIFFARSFDIHIKIWVALPLFCFGSKRIIEKINLIVLEIHILHMYTRNIPETERKFVSRSFLNLSHIYMLSIFFILYFGLLQEMETVSY